MESNVKTALVTGASSGIGKELAGILAHEGYNLVLVARSGGKLEELKSELEGAEGISVRVIPGDLSLRETPDEIFTVLSDEKVHVDVLVNNAGFGEYGRYTESSWEKEEAMIEVNVIALSRLTKLFLPAMIDRGEGRVLNVASMAAFQPGPLMAVYYASKAYVLSFTEALATEYSGSGVTFTTLCPGPVDTGFRKTAGLGASKDPGSLLAVPVGEVAQYAYRAMCEGKRIAIPGAQNRIAVFISRFLSRKSLSRIIFRYQDSKTR